MNKFLPLYIFNLFLVLFFLTPFSGFLKNTATYLLSPFNYVVLSSISNVNETYSSVKKLFEYKQKYDKVNSELISLKSFFVLESKKENLQTETVFYTEIEKVTNAKIVISQIVGYGNTSGVFLIKLNKGYKDQINSGDTVIYQNYLIGNITEVKESVSYASVFFLSDTKIPVRSIKNNTSLILTCKSSLCELQSVLNSEKLDEGEILTTSGFLNSYQEGFIVGSVLKIYSSAENVFKRADVKQEIDIKKISKVAILIYEK
ncbi:hypothetical protein KA001_01280 [Patescibacteria group bacterium]|nr:hypothetical protein [Patescibacteria group bacterium]